MSVSQRLRYEILRRDSFTCRYCGGKAPDVELTVDHVTPVALGGTDEPSNLVGACADCNAGKSSATPEQQVVEDVAGDALRWAAAMKRAAVIAFERRDERDEDLEVFSQAWNIWGYDADGERVPVPRPATWKESVGRLFDAGLGLSDAIEAIEPAMLKAHADAFNRIPTENVFRYFCGICWRMVDDQQQIARDLLAEAGA